MICMICSKDTGYLRAGGRVPLCAACRVREGLSAGHPSETEPKFLRLIRPVHESDDDSPILEDARSGDRRVGDDGL